MKFKLTLLLLIASISLGVAQMKTGMLYGLNHLYSLTAPTGWLLDNQAGVDMGLHAVFYKEGETWPTAKVGMYTNFVTVDSTLTLQQFIDDDIKAFKEQAKTKAGFEKDITTKTGTPVKVYRYEYASDYGTIYEYVGFLRCPTGIITIVSTTKEKKALKAEDKAFEELVKSYMWISDKIEIKD